MKTNCVRAAMVLAMIALGGCSGSDVSEGPELSAADTLAAAAAADASAALAGSIPANAGGEKDKSTDVEPFRNPFAPPTEPPPPPVIETPDPGPEAPVEPPPEIRQPGEPPKIRLLGFTHVGEPKVFVSHREKLITLGVGDTLEDVKVVHIDSPELTMLFEEREIKLKLFEQSWRRDGAAATASSRHSPTHSPSSRPTRSTSAGTPRQPPRVPSKIPGFSSNAGKPPGFQPPAPTGATPGSSLESAPRQLPGLSSEAGGGVQGSGLPSIPGLNLDPSGSGNLPGGR